MEAKYYLDYLRKIEILTDIMRNHQHAWKRCTVGAVDKSLRLVAKMEDNHRFQFHSELSTWSLTQTARDPRKKLGADQWILTNHFSRPKGSWSTSASQTMYTFNAGLLGAGSFLRHKYVSKCVTWFTFYGVCCSPVVFLSSLKKDFQLLLRPTEDLQLWCQNYSCTSGRHQKQASC